MLNSIEKARLSGLYGQIERMNFNMASMAMLPEKSLVVNRVKHDFLQN